MVKNNKDKLTDIEIFYIKENPDKLSVRELAEKLGRNRSTVHKHMVKVVKTTVVEEPTKEVVQEEVKSPVKQTTQSVGLDAKRAFAHVRKKGHSMATVMTPAASEIGDEAGKHNRRSIHDIPSLKNAIHKPYGDDHGE